MTLAFCVDLSAADWVVHSGLPWQQVVQFGPATFDAYARLRFLPDPRPGQHENAATSDSRADPLPGLFGLLATHTATPHDCYFCVWEGFTQTEASACDSEPHDALEGARAPSARTRAVPGMAPERATSPSVSPLPRVVLPHRAYWLFRGPLTEVGRWDTARGWPGGHRLGQAEPGFVWPADRAWCVAHDVDPHWAGIGGTAAMVAELTSTIGLDVVVADPARHQPTYR